MSSYKRQLKLFIFTGLLPFAIGFLSSYYSPKLKSWALIEIESLSRTHLPIGILPGQVSLSFFPLGLKIENIRLLPLKQMKQYIDVITIKSVIITPDYFSLIRMQPQISNIILQTPELKLKIDNLIKTSTDSTPFDKIAKDYMKKFSSLPFSELTIKNGFFDINYKKTFFKSLSTYISIKKKFRRLDVRLSSPSTKYQINHSKKIINSGFNVAFDFSLKNTNIKIIHLYSSKNYVKIKGRLKGIPSSIETTDGFLDIRSSLHLANLQNLLKNSISHWAIPPAKGTVTISSQIDLKPNQQKNKFLIKTKNIHIDQYEIGNLILKGNLNDQSISLEKAQITNSSGTIHFNETTIKTKPEISFLSTAQIDNIDIHQLLIALGIGDVPVELNLKGKLPCAGTFSPITKIKCSGQITGENISVTSSKNNPNIIDVDELQAEGNVEITNQKVTYVAKLKAPNSQGKSSGTINYKKGFSIKYSSPLLSFKDIRNLSGLQLEGITRIKGSTRGTASWGTMNMKINGHKIWLKDYYLGRIGTNIKYQSGFLKLNNITGQQGQTRYNGFFQINTSNSTFKSNIYLPYLEVQDIKKSIQRPLPISINLLGSGKANISINGPLDIEKLSYQLKGFINQGSIGWENYDQATLDIKAHKGVSKAQNVQFIKRNSKIKLVGFLNHKGPIDLKIISQPFYLEDSDIISQSRQSISGQLISTTHLTGDIRHPHYNFQGQVRSLNIEDEPLKDSFFDLTLTDKEFSGKINFFSNIINGSFRYPLTEQGPFLLNLETNKWNYIRFLSFFGSNSLHQEYKGFVSSKFQISSLNGGFWKSSGEIKINDFTIERGHLNANHSRPIRFLFDKGIIDIEDFSLKGKESYLNITGKNFSKDNFNINFNGKTDLRLLQIFTPFADEIGGPLSISFKTSQSALSPEILGAAFVEKGYFKLKDFPDTFTDIRADLLFNQKKILINSLNSSLGNGKVWGEGNIDLNGYKDIPLNIKAHLENTSIQVPKGIKTKGSGSINFTGKWFPYKLSGNYKIHNGLITEEFIKTPKKSPVIEQNQFLPKIFNENTSSLILDLNLETIDSIQIKTDQLQGQVQGHINVQGEPNKPKLKGRMSLKPNSQLIFRDVPFDILTANLKFQQRKEPNPDIDMEATTRLQDYTINLEAQGTLQDPVVSMKSEPELPEEDIVSLLAFGVTSEKLNKEVDSGNQAVQSTWKLGSAILTKNPISKEIKDQLGVNVEFSSSINDSNQAVPKATFSKQLGTKASLSVSINEKKDFNFNAHYRINSNLFLKGSIDGQDNDSVNNDNNTDDENIIGFDIEYKVEFD